MKITLPFFFTFLLSVSSNLPPAEAQVRTQQFDRMVSHVLKAGEPGGVVLVARKGEVVYKRAFGMANVELDVPMREEMVFNVGSITKQFTAVAILQLAEQGKLSLQDEVTKYLTDYPVNGRKITVENLLTHTAGIPGPAPEAMLSLQGRKDLVGLQEVIATFKDRPLDFAPGTKWSYSNDGYILLGAIIEKVSGLSSPAYLEQKIFKPAGMTRTLFDDDQLLVKTRAASYIYSRAESRFMNAMNDKVETAYSAGAIQSTAEDLFRWNQALLSNRLIKREFLEKAQTEYK